jgi:DedD protein
VVTVGSDSTETGGGTPRSGEVDIGGETRELVPEQPTGAAGAEQAAEEKPPAREEAATAPAPARTVKRQEPAEEKVVPAARGSWVVQVGSFGNPENADGEAVRLRDSGWDARVKVGNTADGKMIYRVRIGYFASRDEARTFARQNQDRIPGAIAVHR